MYAYVYICMYVNSTQLTKAIVRVDKDISEQFEQVEGADAWCEREHILQSENTFCSNRTHSVASSSSR